MNIFAVSTDVDECAEYLDDIRLNKMITETAQIMTTAWYNRYGLSKLVELQEQDITVLRVIFRNHPCVLWANDNTNWNWLFSLFNAYCKEWNYRKNKIHGTLNKYGTGLLAMRGGFPVTNRVPKDFTNCVNYLFKTIKDVHLAHELNLHYKWKYDIIKLSWTNRVRPEEPIME